jgi:hypothetical protein
VCLGVLICASGEVWYIGSRQIHEELEVPFLAEHISTLTEGFDSPPLVSPLVGLLIRFLA